MRWKNEKQASELQEARRLREQARELRLKAGVLRRGLGEVVTELLETRKAVQRVRVQLRSEAVGKDKVGLAPPLRRGVDPNLVVPWHLQRDWLGRFAERIRRAAPCIEHDEALKAAIDAWPSFRLIAPETAADLWQDFRAGVRKARRAR